MYRVCAIFLMVIAITLPMSSAFAPIASHSIPTKGFALVELFTSQGCSSCPSADRVLEKITRSARTTNAPIYTLSFHVDYWNYLGWSDPYSKKEFSERQLRYGHAFGDKSIYTPQMIVNGSDTFIGSNSDHAEKSIQNALTNVAPVTIVLHVDTSNSDGLHCTYAINGIRHSTTLNVALVQDMDAFNIPKGENAECARSFV